MTEVEYIFTALDELYFEKSDVIIEKIINGFNEKGSVSSIPDDILDDIISLYVLIKKISLSSHQQDELIGHFIKEKLEKKIIMFSDKLNDLLNYPVDGREKNEFIDIGHKVLKSVRIDSTGKPLDKARNFFPILLLNWKKQNDIASIENLKTSIEEPLKDVALFKGILYARNKAKNYFEENYDREVSLLIKDILKDFNQNNETLFEELREKLFRIFFEEDIQLLEQYRIHPSWQLKAYDPCKKKLRGFLLGKKWGIFRHIILRILERTPKTCSIDLLYNSPSGNPTEFSWEPVDYYIQFIEKPEIFKKLFLELTSRMDYLSIKIYKTYLTLKSDKNIERGAIKIYATLQREFSLSEKELKRIIGKVEYHLFKIMHDVPRMAEWFSPYLKNK